MNKPDECRKAFEDKVRFDKLEVSLDWDPAGFYSQLETDRMFTWFKLGYDHADRQPEVSMQEVLDRNDHVHINLAPLAGLTGTEMVSMLKLAIAAEKPTGSVSQPSAHFATYVQYAVSDELTKASPVPRDVMRERLWAAAQHDVFTNTGGIASMLDAGGLARVDFSAYQSIIDAGLQPLIDAGF